MSDLDTVVSLDDKRHGYGPYTSGCRCAVCRKAKAEYMRVRRLIARANAHNADGVYVAPISRHGTRFGYEEHGCRCDPCHEARLAEDARYSAKRRSLA